jgi:hypothetical protein
LLCYQTITFSALNNNKLLIYTNAMKENINIQSVFKFVTVRGSKKHVNTALKTITYDSESKLYKSILALTSISDSDTRLAKAHELAASYKASNEYLSLESDLEKLVGEDLLAFAEWLSKNKGDLTKQKIANQLKLVSGKLTKTQLSVLWDNLFIGVLAGKSNSVLNSLMLVMTADNLIKNYNTSEVADDSRPLNETLTVLAQTEIILPTFPALRPSVETTTSRLKKDPKEAIEDWGKQAAQFKAAIEELDTYTRRQREILRNSEGSSQKIGMIHDFKILSAETQQVLKDIKASTDLSIDYLMRELQVKATELTRKQFETAKLTKKVLSIGGALWALDLSEDENVPNVKLAKNDATAPDDYDGFYYDDGKCRIKPLGIADYRRVEQELCCYKPGEVAHIENILQGEYKERSTRRLRRKEETFSVSKETEEVTERDSMTTDRYEMQKETEKIIQNDMSFDLGTSVSGSYGPVSMSVNAGFAISSSTTLSDKEAVTYAKEVTERALERVVKKTKEEQITKLIEEFEENNKHGLDNRAGNKHVVGLYRWVDKIYKAQVVNYGKRLMFEFMLTEPGAFHLWAMSEQSTTANGLILEEPIDPRSEKMIGILGVKFSSHTIIDESNYGPLAAIYGAKVEPPPQSWQTVEKSYARELIKDAHEKHFSNEHNDLKVPTGYNVKNAYVRAQIDGGNGGWATVHVGEVSASFGSGNNNSRQGIAMWLLNEQETVPVCIIGRTEFYGVTINIECERSFELLEEWKIKTYGAIIAAYENKKAQYEQSLAQARVQRGVNIMGTNPLMNRAIEQQELKKQCLNWLYQGTNFSSWALWHYGHNGEPHWNIDCDAVKAGENAKFMEQCFDWNLMTYKFLPYFYGAKSRWKKLYQLNDTDPQFLNFLQAGMARVLIPVRPGFEKQIMHFLRTGEVWGGELVPAINSQIYRSIVEELKVPIGAVEGKPWEVRIPTTLTVLQGQSGAVEGSGLPCDCDPENGFGTGVGGILSPVTVAATGDDHTHAGDGTTTTGGGITTTDETISHEEPTNG